MVYVPRLPGVSRQWIASSLVLVVYFPCAACKQGFVWYASLAYVDFNFEFVPRDDTQLSAAVEKVIGSGFTNKATKVPVQLVCFECLEDRHGTKYTKENGKFTSFWRNTSDRTKPGRVPPKKLSIALQNIEAGLKTVGVVKFATSQRRGSISPG